MLPFRQVEDPSHRAREDTSQSVPRATVRCNCKLHNMDIAVPANDERAVEVLAVGLPLHHGSQLAVDITLRSVLQEGPPVEGTEVF